MSCISFLCCVVGEYPSILHSMVTITAMNFWEKTSGIVLCKYVLLNFIDPCKDSPCHNNGTCLARGWTNFECNCLPQFSGPACQIGQCNIVL